MAVGADIVWALSEEMSRQQILESGVAEKQMRLAELDCGLFIPFSVPRLPLVLFGYAMSLGTTWDLAVGFLVVWQFCLIGLRIEMGHCGDWRESKKENVGKQKLG